MLRLLEEPPGDLLKQGWLSYVDGLPDDRSWTTAATLVEPYLKGGALARGDTSHVKEEELKID